MEILRIQIKGDTLEDILVVQMQKTKVTIARI